MSECCKQIAIFSDTSLLNISFLDCMSTKLLYIAGFSQRHCTCKVIDENFQDKCANRIHQLQIFTAILFLLYAKDEINSSHTTTSFLRNQPLHFTRIWEIKNSTQIKHYHCIFGLSCPVICLDLQLPFLKWGFKWPCNFVLIGQIQERMCRTRRTQHVRHTCHVDTHLSG